MPANFGASTWTMERQQSQTQINKYLADRDKALKEGYSEQGYKFNDASEAEKFKGLLGSGKLQAGASIGDGEYMVVRAGSLPSGYQEVGQVSSTIAAPYAERRFKPGFAGMIDPKHPLADVNGPLGYWAPTRGFDANDVRKRYDPVTLYEPGGSASENLVIARRSSMAAPAPEPAKPFTPSKDLETARERATTYLDTKDDDGGAGGGSVARNTTSGPYTDDLIRNINLIDSRAGGYQRRFLNEFLPGLKNTAEVASREVGEAGRHALGQLDAAVKPPVLSDPFSDTNKINDNSLFAQLQKRIKDAGSA